jgi:membrane protein DedA with SNARE-associated domain
LACPDGREHTDDVWTPAQWAKEVDTVWETLGTWAAQIAALGAAGIAVAMVIEGLGLPFPGDAVLALYGWSAAHGDYSALTLVTAAVGGYMTGSGLAYAIGRSAAASPRTAAFRRLLLVSDDQWFRAQAWVRNYDAWLLIPGRFLPGVRSVSAFASGAAGMLPARFVTCTLAGATLWCSTWIGLGLWFGEHTEAVLDAARSALGWVTLTAVCALALVWWKRRSTRR